MEALQTTLKAVTLMLGVAGGGLLFVRFWVRWRKR